MYWLATYTWDSILFLILDVLIMIAFFIYGTSASQAFVGSATQAGAIFTLLVFYGLSVLPINYLYSMPFESYSTCQITVTLINFATGFLMVLAYYIMQSIPQTEAYASTVAQVFRIFPCYNVGEGLIAIVTVNYENQLLNTHLNPFAFEYAGQNMVYMGLEAVGYMMIVLLLETNTPLKTKRFMTSVLIRYGLLKRKTVVVGSDEDTHPVDEDVVSEADRVKVVVKRLLSGVGSDSTYSHAVSVDDSSNGQSSGVDGEESKDHKDDQGDQGSKLDDIVLSDGSHSPPAAGSEDDADKVGITPRSGADDADAPPSAFAPAEYLLILDELDKVYSPTLFRGQPKHALNKLSLCLKAGERFGLLGMHSLALHYFDYNCTK